jgi:uncharacterized OB-fold protein
MNRSEPLPSSLDAPFWAAADDNRLILPLDPATGRATWFPRGEADWTQAVGTGRVETFSIVHRSFYADLPAPYAVVVVRLNEGVLMTGTMTATDGLRIGAPVRTVFQTVGKRRVPGFELAEG